jgi:hypothetical protein
LKTGAFYDEWVPNDHCFVKDEDGSATIHFGGDPKQPNFFPIAKGWNSTVRQYRPRKEFLDGTWKLPESVEVTLPNFWDIESTERGRTSRCTRRATRMIIRLLLKKESFLMVQAVSVSLARG